MCENYVGLIPRKDLRANGESFRDLVNIRNLQSVQQDVGPAFQ